MPSVDRHCKSTELRYGVEARDFHRWIDEPRKVYFGGHRRFRHNPNIAIPQEFILKYGEKLCKEILMDHIILDSVTKGIISDKSSVDEVFAYKETRYEQITKLFYEDINRTYKDISEIIDLSLNTICCDISICKDKGYLPRIPKEEWTKELIRNCLIENEIKMEGIT